MDDCRAGGLKEITVGSFDKSFQGQTSADEVSREELEAAVKSESWALVDVREPHEFDAGRVAGSINLPLSNFQPGDLPTGKPVVLICRSGMRSADALRRARAAGVDDIRHYRGGVIGWANGGGDLV